MAMMKMNAFAVTVLAWLLLSMPTMANSSTHHNNKNEKSQQHQLRRRALFAYTNTTTAETTTVTTTATNGNTEPRIAFIAFTYLGKPKKFHGLIGGALQTYLKNESTYFLVMSKQWQDAYYGEYCKKHASSCKRLTPIWIECGDESWDGTAPCCKVQQGLLHMLEHYSDRYDYFMYMDDDDYIRTPFLKRYLKPFDPSEVFVVGSTRPTQLGAAEFGNYKCSHRESFTYPW